MDENVVEAIKENGATATQRGKSAFDSTSGEERLKTLFSVSSLDAFGGLADHKYPRSVH